MSSTSIVTSPPSLSTRRILRTWWPLAASWLLMTTELPLMSAVIARLIEPEINLAAWGVVFAVSTIIQSGSTMLLAASTALSRDWASYVRLRRFMIAVCTTLTLLHALVAFTPLYYIVMGSLIGVPAEILEPARLGLMIMTPWTWGTGYRRFEQGVLIRFDLSRAVVWGSILRLSVDSLVLIIGYRLGSIPGIVLATSAIIAGVVSESIYAGLRVRPVRNHQLKQAIPIKPTLTFRAFLNFYVPLAVTTLLTLLMQPMVSAALSRMPNALESLAVWPVLFGLLLMWQSMGLAYTEAVIALLDEPRAIHRLRRFTVLLVMLSSLLFLLMTATPLAAFWFSQVAALSPTLAALARNSLWFGLLLPGLRVLQNWYQGVIVYSRQTHSITESVIIFLLITGLILAAGTFWEQVAGVYVGVTALVAGFLAQTIWLWLRSRPIIQNVQARDIDLRFQISDLRFSPQPPCGTIKASHKNQS